MSFTPFVYVAMPLDFVPRTSRPSEEVNALLAKNGMAIYRPDTAFRIPAGTIPTKTVGNINRAALTECDAVLAFLPPPGGSSIGVPMEIEMAREQNKPLMVVGHFEVVYRSWSLPKTDLVLFTDEFDRESAQALYALTAKEHRRRARPAPSRALYVKTDPGAALPTRAYDGDAGFDMYTLEDTLVPAGGFVDVPVGISVQFPDNVWGMIIGRSSTVRKLDLLVTPGVIDTGYRGPLFAGVRSLRADDYTVKRGERLAQILPFPNMAQQIHPIAVDVLTPSDRGEMGFGSSGA